MKAYIEVNFNTKLPINVDVQNAVDGLEYLGYDIKPFTKIDVLDSFNFKQVIKNNIFVAGIDTMQKIFNLIGKYPNDIDFPKFLFDKNLINRNIIKTNLKEAVGEKYLNKFIKPVKTKLFDGILISDMKDFNYLKDFDSNTEVYVSDKINIVSEYRCYIHNRKLVYACNYSGDFTKNIDYNYVQKLIDGYDEQPIAYTIDIAYLDDNRCDVIEFNDFYSIGSYGLYCINYAEMLRDRYLEIIK